jgi:hypothetical protein
MHVVKLRTRVLRWTPSVTLTFDGGLGFCVWHTTQSFWTFVPNYYIILQRMSKIKTGQIRTDWRTYTELYAKKGRLSRAHRKRARQKLKYPVWSSYFDGSYFKCNYCKCVLYMWKLSTPLWLSLIRVGQSLCFRQYPKTFHYHYYWPMTIIIVHIFKPL